MKKWLFTFLMTILALPVFGTAVFAEDTIVYEDGTYENIPFVVKHGENVYDQFSETATITIEDGEQYIRFTHTGLNLILDVTIPDGEVDILNDEENDTREVGFGYQGDLSEPLPFTIHMFYGMAHDMDAYLDMSNVPVVDPEEEIDEPEEEPENPEEDTEDPGENEEEPGNSEEDTEDSGENDEESNEPPVEENESDNTDPALIADEAYTITYTSNIDLTRYFDNPAVLLYKDGKTYIQLTGAMGQYIGSLSINDNEATIGEISDDGSYVAQFAIEGSLSAEFEFTMHVNTPMGAMEHTAKLSFDEGAKESVNVNDYVLLSINNEEDEETEAPEEEEETEAPEEDDELEEDNGKEDKEDNNKEEVKGDKVSTIDFVFKHATEDKASAADSFFAKPAVIIERDGEKYVQITATNPEYIDSLVAVFGNDRVAFKLIDGTNNVYEFKLPNGYDLSKEILVEMVISVPGFYEGQHYDTRLVFDMDTLKEIEVGEDIPEPTPNPNPSPDPSPDSDPKPNPGPNTPEKPELGDEKDNGDVAPAADNNGPSGNGLNPQTGENTNLLLYALLLIGSAIPLAVQVRRRFI